MKPVNLAITLTSLLFIDLSRRMLFPEWIIASRVLRIVDIIVIHLFIAWVISALFATVFKSWQVFFVVGFWMTVFAGCSAGTFIKPLDSTSIPKDIAVLKQEENKKVIVIEYINYKHNEVIRDTITVVEKFGFRKVIY